MSCSVGTIQEHIDDDMVVTAYCGRFPACMHREELDLEALKESLGPDFMLVGNDAFTRALRCAQCGHKGGSLIVSPRFRTDYHKRMVRNGVS